MSTLTPISYDDLESAFNWSSSGAPYENQALICRRTGTVYLQGDFVDEELPSDIEDETPYVAMPHKNDLDLGRDVVFAFVDSEAPQLATAVHAAFRKRGAYAKFKEILDREGMLQSWYDYEAAAIRLALTNWALEQGLVVQDPSRETPSSA
jgi:hypothetical protein